jgi:murein DD-endopeptidase MepM/ murein hydrolase activator NlpD
LLLKMLGAKKKTFTPCNSIAACHRTPKRSLSVFIKHSFPIFGSSDIDFDVKKVCFQYALGARMTGTDSFDPRTWSNPTATPKPLPPETGKRPPVIAPPKSPKGGRYWQPFAASIILLTLGGAGAWLTRTPRSVPETGTTAEPAATTEIATPADQSESRRTLILAGPQDLNGALVAAGIKPDEAAAATAKAVSALGATGGEIRATLVIKTEADGVHLVRLEASHPDGSGAVVARDASGELTGSRVAAELSKQIQVVRGEMDANSFYSSAVAAGVTDSLIPDFANAFAFDFDLQQEVQPGDIFEVAFEQTVNANGEAVGAPRLLYASLDTAAKSRALYRFQPVGQEVGWFDGNGGSTVRSFMKTPVDGARISSKFGFRIHPVLGYAKLHRGTDFAAPTGTPIFASGDAVVEWAAMKGPNGNLTILRHDNGWQTFYLHQSMFMPGIGPGVRVHQGQKIGEIGTTGRSTGPHLHYEVHIDGQAVDPQSIKTESGRKGLEGAEIQAFIRERDRIDVARARNGQ